VPKIASRTGGVSADAPAAGGVCGLLGNRFCQVTQFLREDLLGDRPERAVAAGVIGVVGVDQQLSTLGRFLRSAAQIPVSVCGCDDDSAAVVDEVPIVRHCR
jgi:hypothetical protein